jgi:hypothetical protein
LAAVGADGSGGSLLRDALDATVVVPGLVAVAGSAQRWAAVRVTSVNDVGKVRFTQLGDDDPEAVDVIEAALAAGD